MENPWVILYKAIHAQDWDKAIETGKILIDTHVGKDDVHPLFEELLNPNVLKLFKDVELLSCKPKQVIMKEGEMGDAMFIVINGQVEVSTAPPKPKAPLLPIPPVLINYYVTNLLAGKKVSLAKLGSGTVLGEISLISSRPRSSTVTAIKTTELIKITKTVFNNVIKQKPQLRSMLTDIYISRLERSADGLKNAGKSVNSCVCNIVVDKIRGTTHCKVPDNTNDSNINYQSSGVSKEFVRTDADMSGIEAYLKDIESQYKKGSNAGAMVSYMKLGTIFAKNIMKDFAPNTDNITSILSMIKIKVPVLGNIIERLPFIPQEIIEPKVIVHQPSIAAEIDTIDDNFLSLFNKHVVKNLDEGSLRRFKDKEIVFKEGDVSDEVYVVKDGKAKGYINRTQIIGEFDVGAVFGEFAFVTGNPRTATIKANGDLTVYELKRPFLTEILQKHPEILTQFNSIYQRHINELIERINVTKEEFKKLISVNA